MFSLTSDQSINFCFLVLENGRFSSSSRSTVVQKSFYSQPSKKTTEEKCKQQGLKKQSGLLFQYDNTRLAQRTLSNKSSLSGLEIVGNKCTNHQRNRPVLQSLGKSADHKVALSTLRLLGKKQICQRHVSVTGRKGDSSWRLSDEFAQSVSNNKSYPQNLTLLRNKCGIVPRGRNFRLTSISRAKLVTEEHNVPRLRPGFLPELQGSRCVITARENLLSRSRHPFHQQVKSGEGQRGVWVQNFVNSVSSRQCHSLPTVHNQGEEEMSFYRMKGITIEKHSRTLRYCSVDEKRGHQAITAPENKIFSSEYKIGCSSCGVFVTEKPNYTHTLNVASTVVACNESSGVQVGKGTELNLPVISTKKRKKTKKKITR